MHSTINPSTKMQAVFWQLFGYKKKCVKLEHIIFVYFLRLSSCNIENLLLVVNTTFQAVIIYGHFIKNCNIIIQYVNSYPTTQ